MSILRGKMVEPDFVNVLALLACTGFPSLVSSYRWSDADATRQMVEPNFLNDLVPLPYKTVGRRIVFAHSFTSTRVRCYGL